MGDFRVFVEYSTEGGVPPECPAGRLSGGRRLAHPARRVSHRFSDLHNDSLSALGDLYTGREGISTLLPISFIPSYPDATLAKVNFSGGFFEGSWNHRYSGRSDTTLSYQRYAPTNVLAVSLIPQSPYQSL